MTLQSTTITINSTPNNDNCQEREEQQQQSIITKSGSPTTATTAAEIVYVIAPSGTGKTFAGDYLALMHGFEHVDGDGPLKNQHLPQYKDMAAKAWKCTTEYMKKNQDGPNELWEPYFAELARQTLEAAETSDRVVLTHATYRQKYRDFVLRKLEEGAAAAKGKTNVTVLTLTIDEDVKLRGLYYRSKHLIDAGGNGTTLGDHMRETFGWDGGANGKECTQDDYVEFFKINPTMGMGGVTFEDVPCGKFVDVSSRNMDTLDAIDEALGLAVGGNKKRLLLSSSGGGNLLTYEEIVGMVKAVDAKRDEEFSKNVDIKQMTYSNEDDDDSDSSADEEKDVTTAIINNNQPPQQPRRRSSCCSIPVSC